MKIRMNDKSVRLRLLRSEVERFGATGSVAASIEFANGRALRYRLARGESGDTAVSFTEDAIEVIVPAREAAAWAEGPQVGIYGKSGSIEIIVEKDFRRTSAPSPDDDDRYPNPRAAKR